MNSPARGAPQDPSVDGPISNPNSDARERNPRKVIDEIAAAVEWSRQHHACSMAGVEHLAVYIPPASRPAVVAPAAAAEPQPAERPLKPARRHRCSVRSCSVKPHQGQLCSRCRRRVAHAMDHGRPLPFSTFGTHR